ncbi:MAG: hypothetical protein JWN86_1959 [Planctomycetota bacterium]|nr:hypothetical protein [Planctomycetota bacterium]
MAIDAETRNDWTALDLFRRFGPIPIWRIRRDPAPGTATEQNLITIHDHEDGLYELVDGVLVKKTGGLYESHLAGLIGTFLSNFVRPLRSGVVVGADGPYRLNPGLIRIPDASFLSRERIPGHRMPQEKVCPAIPNLAVEVLSESNTKKEMAAKLADYFACGVELVWYVDPQKKTVRAYTAPDRSRLVRESGTLDGGTVLPGFALALRDLFADPIGPMA